MRRFDYDLELELAGIRRELLEGTWRPAGYRSFYVFEGKRRLISAAPFRDRVVHHALCNVIEPIYEARFLRDSYASRRGKGTHRAVRRCQHYLRQYGWFMKSDIVKFFPSVDHEVLISLVAKKIRDPRLMDVVRRIVSSGAGILDGEAPRVYFPGDDLFSVLRPRGIPIGNQTSQFLANVYLDPLDRFVKEVLRAPGYVRYCDDFVVLAGESATLHRWHGEIERFLAGMRLVIHPRKTYIAPTREGVPFLGWHVHTDHLRLRRRNVDTMRRRVRRFREGLATGRLSPAEVTRSVQAWVGHASFGDTWGLRKDVLGSMRLRCGERP